MKSFIVTFYRHGGKDNPETVIGTVEETGRQSERKFTSMAELYRLLGDEEARWKKKPKKRVKENT